MAGAYGWADLVGRARGRHHARRARGVAGVGAILVPFPAAIDDHQTRNAEHFTRAGAGLQIAEQELTPNALADALTSCLEAISTGSSRCAEAARKQAHRRRGGEARGRVRHGGGGAAMNDRMGKIHTIHFVGIGGSGHGGHRRGAAQPRLRGAAART